LWWCAAAGLSILVLVFPALFNGFPLVFYDTGGYIARAFEAELAPGRSVTYGYFLWVLEMDFAYWPVILLQSSIVLWLIHVCARVHDLPRGPLTLAATVICLALGTGLPWFTSQLMPDIWTSVLVLALYLVGFQSGQLSRWEKTVLIACCVLSLASHMSHIALGIGLVLIMLTSRLVMRPRSRHTVKAGLPVLILVLGTCAIPSANWLAAGQFRFTPGGQTFLFGRLIQDGIVSRFLAEHCPSPEYRLCAFRDRMPATADDWIWGYDGPFIAIGGWEGGAPEMSRIMRESLSAYPGQHIASALGSTWEQMIRLDTGDGIDLNLWHTRYILERYEPVLLPVYDAARQQTIGFTFTELNHFHIPLAYLSLVAMVILGWHFARREADLALMIAFVLIALVGNAFICGAMSNPHGRYQSRVVWLAMLCVILVGQRMLQKSGPLNVRLVRRNRLGRI
jgi:hypothetical protein